jgi:N-acyl-D-amino-acid deacylase
VRRIFLISILSFNLILSCSEGLKVDVLIENGTIYDGTGNSPFKGSVAIKGEKIIYIGSPKSFQATTRIDATNQAVAPGFINMLSWGVETLIEDGKSQSDIRQGVTLEVFGEGMSWGPLNEEMKVDLLKKQGDIHMKFHGVR